MRTGLLASPSCGPPAFRTRRAGGGGRAGGSSHRPLPRSGKKWPGEGGCLSCDLISTFNKQFRSSSSALLWCMSSWTFPSWVLRKWPWLGLFRRPVPLCKRERGWALGNRCPAPSAPGSTEAWGELMNTWGLQPSCGSRAIRIHAGMSRDRPRGTLSLSKLQTNFWENARLPSEGRECLTIHLDSTGR